MTYLSLWSLLFMTIHTSKTLKHLSNHCMQGCHPGLNILPRFTHILFYYYTFIYLCVLLSVFGFNFFHITYFSVLVAKIVRNLLFGTILLKINLLLAIAGHYTNNGRSFGMISAGIITICLFCRTSWLILSSHYF